MSSARQGLETAMAGHLPRWTSLQRGQAQGPLSPLLLSPLTFVSGLLLACCLFASQRANNDGKENKWSLLPLLLFSAASFPGKAELNGLGRKPTAFCGLTLGWQNVLPLSDQKSTGLAREAYFHTRAVSFTYAWWQLASFGFTEQTTGHIESWPSTEANGTGGTDGMLLLLSPAPTN